MSTHLIFTREKTLDQAELETYSKAVPATTTGGDLKQVGTNTPVRAQGKA